MPRYSDSKIKKSKESILNSAGRLFREKGYSGAGIKEIMNEAGLTNGTFYAHFSSKADLFTKVIALANETRRNAIESIPTNNSNDRARIFIQHYLSEDHLKSKTKGCLMPGLSSDLARHRKSSEKKVDDYLNELIKIFVDAGLNLHNSELLSSSLVGSLIMARSMKPKDSTKFLSRSKENCLSLYDNFNNHTNNRGFNE